MELRHVATRQGRLSSFLKEEMQMSSGLINRLKWQNKIFVNGVPQHNDYGVQPGDVISVPLDEERPEYPAEEGELTILYEDEYILAADKPAGILIHPSRSTMTGTLANRVLGYYQKTGQHCAFHPITRLDRDTFGVVLLAKNAHIHSKFTQMQVRGEIQKTYEALVVGCPQAEEGIIDAPIARRPLPSLLRYVDETGKASVTKYKVLKKGKISHLWLQPVTGRTHQLRVHCAYMGFPILADPQYGEKIPGQTQRLCAKSITFPHPVTGGNLTILSQLTP